MLTITCNLIYLASKITERNFSQVYGTNTKIYDILNLDRQFLYFYIINFQLRVVSKKFYNITTYIKLPLLQNIKAFYYLKIV